MRIEIYICDDEESREKALEVIAQEGLTILYDGGGAKETGEVCRFLIQAVPGGIPKKSQKKKLEDFDEKHVIVARRPD